MAEMLKTLHDEEAPRVEEDYSQEEPVEEPPEVPTPEVEEATPEVPVPKAEATMDAVEEDCQEESNEAPPEAPMPQIEATPEAPVPEAEANTETAHDEDGERTTYWQVVYNGRSGGILVRDGQSLNSNKLPDVLSTSALVEELQLEGERLKYKLVSGAGPESGWVSLRVRGEDMLVRSSKEKQTYWEVVYSGGGIVVRDDKSLDSNKLPAPLSTGALVEELHVEGNRLQYKLLNGTGPESGWVSLRLRQEDLLVRSSEASRMYWEVVGGSRSGGIVVREGASLDSNKLPAPLSTGALVKALQLEGERLQYELLDGTGPESGWVSLRLGPLGRADLLVRRQRDDRPDAAEQ